MEVSYSMAYKEVLEMIKKLPESEYNKIPIEKIKFYQNNCHKSYNFILKDDLSNLSQKANAIIISIYKNYFTTPTQKEKLKSLLNNNSQMIEQQKREKYNPNEIFLNNVASKEEIENENMQIIKYEKKNIITKIFDKLKNIFIRYEKIAKEAVKKLHLYIIERNLWLLPQISHEKN